MPVPAVSPAYRDLSSWVAMQILEAIKSGQITPGERLVEREIAERFGVSRAPVRDAIHKLENLGVVVREGSRATYVRSWTATDAVNLVVLLDAMIALSVRLAAIRLQPEDLAELESIVEETRAAVANDPDNAGEQVALDVKFHLVIARVSGNPQLRELIETLWIPVSLYHEQFLASVGRWYSLQEHTELLEALRRGDPDEAETCARGHAQKGMTIVVRALHERTTEQLQAAAG